MFDQNAIDAFNQKQQEELERQQALDAVAQVGEKVDAVKKAVDYGTAKLISDKNVNPAKVKVLNDLATPDDINKVVDALNKLSIALKPEPNDDTNVVEAINRLSDQLKELPSEMPEVEPVEEVTVKNIGDFKSYIQPLIDAVDGLQLNPIFDPKIEVKPADVKVTTEKLDTSDIKKAIDNLSKEFAKLAAKEQPETDLTPLIQAVGKTTATIQNLKFPVPNYVLPFTKDGKATQITLNSDGSLPVTNTVSSTAYSKPTDEYDLIQDDDTSSASYEYYGFMKSDGSWFVKRITLSTNLREYAKGASNYTTNWTNRASLTYADYGTTF